MMTEGFPSPETIFRDRAELQRTIPEICLFPSGRRHVVGDSLAAGDKPTNGVYELEILPEDVKIVQRHLDTMRIYGRHPHLDLHHRHDGICAYLHPVARWRTSGIWIPVAYWTEFGFRCVVERHCINISAEVTYDMTTNPRRIAVPNQIVTGCMGSLCSESALAPQPGVMNLTQLGVIIPRERANTQPTTEKGTV